VGYWFTERGAVELRPVSVKDLPEFARAAAARADELLAARTPRQMLKHFERICERCDSLFCARRSNARFCPACGLLRARASDRRGWQRRGKLSPSYQRKLKGPRRTAGESVSLPRGGHANPRAQGALVFP